MQYIINLVLCCGVCVYLKGISFISECPSMCYRRMILGNVCGVAEQIQNMMIQIFCH